MKHWAIGLGLAMVPGCYAGIPTGGDDPSGMPDTDGASGGSSGGDADDAGTDDGQTGGEDPPGTADCAMGPQVAAETLVRLTQAQYDATVRDLVGVDASVARTGFSADVRLDQDPETPFVEGAPVTALVAKQLMLGAETISAQVDVPAVSNCDGGEACVEAFLTDISTRGFRRPATTDELDVLRSIYDAEPSHDAGVRAVVEAVLQSPSFIYLILPDTSGAQPGDVVALDDWSLASRLSYFAWGTMPDAALFDAAASGSLSTEEGLAAQLDRLLADPRAEEGVRGFYDAVLELERIATLTKAPESYPDFTTEIADDLHTSLWTALRALHFEDDGTLGDLAAGLPLYANDRLAAYYGLPPGPGEAFEPVLDAGGVLAHPGMAALLAKPTESAIVERGVFVRAALLCNPLPPPPPEVEAELPEGGDWDSPRERFEEHRADPSCAGCHDLIDPIGYAMETLDGDGRARTEYPSGVAVDPSGELLLGSDTQSFETLSELEAIIGGSEAFESCMVDHWLAYATRRVPGALDACAHDDIAAATREAGGSVETLLRATVLSEGFRYVMVTE
ncbi:MAG: DUF1592 domain-containing protein [Myxococcota bacterium]